MGRGSRSTNSRKRSRGGEHSVITKKKNPPDRKQSGRNEDIIDNNDDVDDTTTVIPPSSSMMSNSLFLNGGTDPSTRTTTTLSLTESIFGSSSLSDPAITKNDDDGRDYTMSVVNRLFSKPLLTGDLNSRQHNSIVGDYKGVSGTVSQEKRKNKQSKTNMALHTKAGASPLTPDGTSNRTTTNNQSTRQKAQQSVSSSYHHHQFKKKKKAIIAKEMILRRRERYSENPLLVTSLDFPNVFERERQHDEVELPFEEQVIEMAHTVREHGLCIIRNVIDTSILQGPILSMAKELQQRVCNALDERGIIWRCKNSNDGSGSISTITNTTTQGEEDDETLQMFRFQEAASRCRGRVDAVLVHGSGCNKYGGATGNPESLLNINKEIVSEILKNQTVYSVIKNLLGDTQSQEEGEDSLKLVYAGLILNLPGSDNQPWHQDGIPLFPEVGNTAAANIQASLPPYALNVFIPIETEDGSLERGPTEFYPGSHRWSAEQLNSVNVNNGSSDSTVITNSEEEGGADDNHDDFGRQPLSHKPHAASAVVISPILKQGDVLIYDYRTCHRGTSNLATVESSKVRRILYLMYARPWFTDHVNFDYTESAESLFEVGSTPISRRVSTKKKKQQQQMK